MLRIGFFAGSFDPPTHGHLDLVRRAAVLVDRLHVGVGCHAGKTAWLSAEERVTLLRQLVPEGVVVEAFDGLAVVAAQRAGSGVLIRGVRHGSDLDAEMSMALANERLSDGALPTVLMPASPGVAHVSSRLVREIFRGGGDVSAFVPAEVVTALRGLPRMGDA